MKTLYLANSFGFAETTRPELYRIKKILSKKYIVLEPFEQNAKIANRYLALIEKETNINVIERLYREMAYKIGKQNVELMERSDVMLAIFDAPPVEEGVASEVGYFYAKNKPVYALKTDFRPRGDNPFIEVNLQIEYFVKDSGGKIFKSVAEMTKYMYKIA